MVQMCAPPRSGIGEGPSQGSRRRSPRVGLFGLFGSGNFGNDGSLEAMIGIVRRACPEARLICFCDGPQRVRERFGIDAVAMKAPDAGVGTALRRLRSVLLAIPNFFMR